MRPEEGSPRALSQPLVVVVLVKTLDFGLVHLGHYGPLQLRGHPCDRVSTLGPSLPDRTRRRWPSLFKDAEG